MYKQQSLDLDFHNRLTFSSFYISKRNSIAVDYVSNLGESSASIVYLWGGSGVGKSHLLQALGEKNFNANIKVSYIPLEYIEDFSIEIFDSLETYSIVLIDDIQSIAGKDQWQEALFHLFNRVNEYGMTMIVTSTAAPPLVGITLPDLVSRLSWGAVFNLHAMDDDEKISALTLHAKQRGLVLPQQTAQFLLSHCQRNMHHLISALHTLDQASMEEQRKITIPFIKKTLFL